MRPLASLFVQATVARIRWHATQSEADRVRLREAIHAILAECHLVLAELEVQPPEANEDKAAGYISEPWRSGA